MSTWRGVLVASGVCGVLACSNPIAPTPRDLPDEVMIEGVRFVTVTSVSAGHRIVTTASATNLQDVRVELEILGQGCRLRPRAFRDVGRGGVPAWDHSGWSPNCTDRGFEIQLDAGESTQFSNEVQVMDVLGDSLPEGRYYFTARLSSDGNDQLEILSGADELLRP